MDNYYYELGTNRIVARDHYILDNDTDIYNMKTIMSHFLYENFPNLK